MKFGWMLAGICMLFLPNVALFDVFPDFLGYIFLLIGITPWADVSPEMAGAKKGFLRLFHLGLFKTLTMFLLLTVKLAGALEDIGFVGLFTLIFNGLDAFFLLSAFNRFFDGMSYLDIRHGGGNAFKRAADTRTMTYIFILVKSVLGALAEFGDLFNSKNAGTVTSNPTMDLGQYNSLLLSANLLLTTVVGAIWLTFMIQYLRDIQKETEFVSRVDAVYDAEVRPITSLFLRRRMHTAFLLLSGGMLCMIDLMISGINIIPDALGALLFCGGLFVLRKDKLFDNRIFYPIGGYFLLALAEEIVSGVLYYNNMDKIRTYGFSRYPQILRMYVASATLQALSAILFAIGMFAFARIFRKIISQHTGFVSVGNDTYTERRNAQLHQELAQQIRIFLVLSVILGLSQIVHSIVLPWFATYWLIHIILSVIWVFHSTRFLSMLRDQIEYKYL